MLELKINGDGFAAAFLSLDSGTTGELTPPSMVAAGLPPVLRNLAGLPAGQVLTRLAQQERPFTITPSGLPALRVAWRTVPASTTAATSGTLPPGPAVVLVGREADPPYPGVGVCG